MLHSEPHGVAPVSIVETHSAIVTELERVSERHERFVSERRFDELLSSLSQRQQLANQLAAICRVIGTWGVGFSKLPDTEETHTLLEIVRMTQARLDRLLAADAERIDALKEHTRQIESDLASATDSVAAAAAYGEDDLPARVNRVS